MNRLPSPFAVYALLLFGLISRSSAQTPPPAVDRAIAAEIAERFAGDRARFLAHLKSRGITAREYRREVEARIGPSDPETVVPAVAQGEQLHLRLIQLQRRPAETDAQLLARGQDVLAQIQAGETFAEVAKRDSTDARRAKGGDWGWLQRSDLKKEFAAVAFSLNKGDTSAPIVTPDGCFLFFVEDRR